MFLGYIIWEPDPVIFSVGQFSVRWYPVLLFIGFYISYLLLKKIYKQERQPVKILESFGLFIILAIFIGGRLFHCFIYEPEYYLSAPLEIIKPWKGKLGDGAVFTGISGLSGHGSALALIIAIFINAKRTKTPLLWILDRIALFGPLVGSFVRIGNLVNSEILGIESHLPWAFMLNNVSHIPRHPVQLYEALAYFTIFIIVYKYYNNRREKCIPGSILGLVLILVYSARFFIEFTKAPQTLIESSRLINYGQLLSIPFIIAGLFLFIAPYYKKHKYNYN